MNPYWLAAIPFALLVGYMRGREVGREGERQRVNHGMLIAMEHLISPALYLLNGWNRGDIPEDELRAGIKEYAAAKMAKREGEQQALLERLGRHGKDGGP